MEVGELECSLDGRMLAWHAQGLGLDAQPHIKLSITAYATVHSHPWLHRKLQANSLSLLPFPQKDTHELLELWILKLYRSKAQRVDA